MKTIIAILIFIWIPLITSICQSSVSLPDTYCKNEVGVKIDNLSDYHRDSLYIIFNKTDSILEFNIVNTTSDTVYLFRSYLYDFYYSSKYLHRIDIKNKLYKISLLPIIPYLHPTMSDRLNLSADRVGLPFNVLIDFVKLNPNNCFKVRVKLSLLFDEIYVNKKMVCDIDLMSLSKFTKHVDFIEANLPEDFNNYKCVFEFALYKNICLLCSKEAYALKELEFNEQLKSFIKYTVPVDLFSFFPTPVRRRL